jgi:hypothetical protein
MERGNGDGRGRTDDEDFHRWLHQTAKSENQTANQKTRADGFRLQLPRRSLLVPVKFYFRPNSTCVALDFVRSATVAKSQTV